MSYQVEVRLYNDLSLYRSNGTPNGVFKHTLQQNSDVTSSAIISAVVDGGDVSNYEIDVKGLNTKRPIFKLTADHIREIVSKSLVINVIGLNINVYKNYYVTHKNGYYEITIPSVDICNIDDVRGFLDLKDILNKKIVLFNLNQRVIWVTMKERPIPLFIGGDDYDLLIKRNRYLKEINDIKKNQTLLNGEGKSTEKLQHDEKIIEQRMESLRRRYLKSTNNPMSIQFNNMGSRQSPNKNVGFNNAIKEIVCMPIMYLANKDDVSGMPLNERMGLLDIISIMETQII
jgi:hypothetical protein